MKIGDRFLWVSCNWKKVVVEIIQDLDNDYWEVLVLEATKEPNNL